MCWEYICTETLTASCSHKPFCQKRREHSLVHLLDNVCPEKKMNCGAESLEKTKTKHFTSFRNKVLDKFCYYFWEVIYCTIRQHGLLLPGCDSAIGERRALWPTGALKYLRFLRHQVWNGPAFLLVGRGAHKSSAPDVRTRATKGELAEATWELEKLRCLFTST